MTVAEDPPQNAKPTTPYEAIGGTEVIRRVVDRFYDLVESDAAYKQLRDLHAPDLSPMRVSLTGFLTAWMGGPRDWHEEREGACVLSLHKPFAIDAALAEQWISAMSRALADCDIEPDFAKQMTAALAQMCAGMVNR